MCGICGGIGLQDERILQEMAECIVHRGPDDTGTHLDDDVMLANQRLSVIDVEGGNQPIYNEDGDVVVVYNGEIYNYRELKADLEDAGHRFATRTDTEVLVHGYEEYGSDVFSQLNGMFAVALWDASRSTLLLARDRAGIKPIHYASVEDTLLFASEPKSILRSGMIDPAVDHAALRYFLQLRYSPTHTTLFDGVESVRPGHFHEISPAEDGLRHETTKYWQPPAPSTPPANPAAAVRECLKNAVDRQLMSDVPVGFYLSGGLDTSSVVAMASELSDEPIDTFCMGFADQQWDERDDARAVADHFGTNHHEFTIDQEFMRDFPEMIWHADEPKRNLYPYYVAREMADNVRVALGGLGADELFGGYVYRFRRLHSLAKRRVASDSSAGESGAVTGMVSQPVDGLENVRLVDPDRLESDAIVRHLDRDERLYVLLNSSDVFTDVETLQANVFGEGLADGPVPASWIRDQLPAEAPSNLVERGLYLDFCVKMPNDFLLVEDRMSMAHSLESRVPFLDNEMIDLAFSLPLSEKFGDLDADRNVGKAVLREAMSDLLPSAVFEKEKQGFTMPTVPFVRNELFEHARNILDAPYVVRNRLVRARYVDALLNNAPTGSNVAHYKLLWRLVALEIWYQMYVVDGATGPDSIEEYYT